MRSSSWQHICQGCPRKNISMPIKALSIALLNMSVSVFGYYLLKIGFAV